MLDNDILTSESIKMLITERRREVAARSYFKFLNTYLPKHISLPFCDMHKKIIQKLNSTITERGSRIAIAAPRGYGKSTLISFAFVIYLIIQGYEKYILLVASTKKQSQQYIEQIRNELENNVMINDDYPQLCQIFKRLKKTKLISKDKIQFNNGTTIQGVWARQRISGIKHNNTKPTLIIVDDLENHESIEDSEIHKEFIKMDKREKWFHNTLTKTGSTKTNIIVTGYLAHKNCLLAKLINDSPDIGTSEIWESKAYSAVSSWGNQLHYEMWMDVRYSLEEYNGKTGIDGANSYFKDHEESILSKAIVLWPEHEGYQQLLTEFSAIGEERFQLEKQNMITCLDEDLLKHFPEYAKPKAKETLREHRREMLYRQVESKRKKTSPSLTFKPTNGITTTGFRGNVTPTKSRRIRPHMTVS